MTEVSLPCGEVKVIPRPYEEKAYAYADKQAEIYRGLKEPSGGYANVVDAYIAVAKENGIQWHDLQKDPNDLPTKDGEYWYYMLCDGGNYIYRAVVFQGNVFNHFYNAKIIMWCETPKFEEG